MEAPASLPIVDFSRAFGDAEGGQKIATEIESALHNFGYVYLVNHGVAAEAIQDAFAVGRTFFELPPKTKAKYRKTLTDAEGRLTGRGYNGYSPPSSELVHTATVRVELKETYECMQREYADADGGRKYPDPALVPRFAEVTERLGAEFRALATRFNAVLGVALGLEDPGFFCEHTRGLTDPATVPALNQLRLAFYQATHSRGGLDETTTRCGQHVDASMYTILVQDPSGGLEVMDLEQKGIWTRLPAQPLDNFNAILIQTGDQLELWSGGHFPAALHQVRIPDDGGAAGGPEIPARQSIAFFVTPDDATQVRPLATKFSNAEGQAETGLRYGVAEWKAYDHYIWRLTQAYSEGTLAAILRA